VLCLKRALVSLVTLAKAPVASSVSVLSYSLMVNARNEEGATEHLASAHSEAYHRLVSGRVMVSIELSRLTIRYNRRSHLT
jgi:hypothetical protein